MVQVDSLGFQVDRVAIQVDSMGSQVDRIAFQVAQNQFQLSVGVF